MRILVVEDEHVLAETLTEVLQSKGYEASAIENGIEAFEAAKTGAYDLIVLDVLLPGMDGMQIAKNLRAQHVETPILMLTAKTQVEDRVDGLNAGADYYMPKPFDLREFLACVAALLRREGAGDEGLTFGNTALLSGAAKLCVGDESIRLSAREFEVMKLLLKNGENNTSKHTLLNRVWGQSAYYSENNVEVYIGFLRKKLKSLGSNVRIVASRGMGYHLELASDVVEKGARVEAGDTGPEKGTTCKK